MPWQAAARKNEEGGPDSESPLVPDIRDTQSTSKLSPWETVTSPHPTISRPVSVPVLEPNLLVSMPSRCSMLT